MKNVTRLVACIGALSIGCVVAAENDRASAAQDPLQDWKSYYFMYRGGRVYELNGVQGPCRKYGGCTLATDQNLDLRKLGLSPDEEAQFRTEAREGRVVLYGNANLVVYVPPSSTEAGVPALITVDSAWRMADGAESDAPFYALSRSLPAGGGPTSWQAEPVATARVNTEERETVGMIHGIPPAVTDIETRGGLLVQGTMAQEPSGDEDDGTSTVPVLRAQMMWRRWVPRAQTDSDWCPVSECTDMPLPTGPTLVCEGGLAPRQVCRLPAARECGWTPSCP